MENGRACVENLESACEIQNRHTVLLNDTGYMGEQ